MALIGIGLAVAMVYLIYCLEMRGDGDENP